MSQTQCALAPAVFQFQSNEVRTTVIDGDPWFVAQDVLNALEYAEKYTPKRAINHVPEEWKGLHPMKTPGGKQAVLCISEQGLYFFLGRSDKPKALPFQKWLAGEVLPAIRKTGRYEAAPSHQNTPVETGESTQIEAAYNAAHYAAVTASQYIFKAELEQKDWINQRFVFGFDDPKTGLCWCKPLEYNALLVPLARLAEMIAEPGGFLLTNAELVRLATACCQRLALRLPTIDPKAA